MQEKSESASNEIKKTKAADNQEKQAPKKRTSKSTDTQAKKATGASASKKKTSASSSEKKSKSSDSESTTKKRSAKKSTEDKIPAIEKSAAAPESSEVEAEHFILPEKAVFSVPDVEPDPSDVQLSEPQSVTGESESDEDPPLQEKNAEDTFASVIEKESEMEISEKEEPIQDDSSEKEEPIQVNVSEKEEITLTESEEKASPDEEKEDIPSSVDKAKETSPVDIPESETVFVTEPEAASIPLFESAQTKNESDLLDIDHFFDYRPNREKNDHAPTYEAEESYNEYHAQSYESLTILGDDDDETSIPVEPKQKYENPDRKRYDPENPRAVDARFDFIELFIFTLLAVILITTFIFRHSVVEGGSMENTLYDGEHLIITNLFYTPERGDIVVCQDRATGLEKPIIKRIIAIEGDTIEIRNNQVIVNGEVIEEEYVFTSDRNYVYEDFAEQTVPENTVFVMGDHRDASTDSRKFYSTFVREDAILGKVILRFFPFDSFGTVD